MIPNYSLYICKILEVVKIMAMSKFNKMDFLSIYRVSNIITI